MIGHGLAATGFALQPFSDTFAQLALGQSIAMIGASLVSGADDALFFSKLNFETSSTHWRTLRMKSGQIVLIALLASTIIGGFLYGVDESLPWLFSSLAFLGAALLVRTVAKQDHTRVPRTTDKDIGQSRKDRRLSAPFSSYLRTLRAGFTHFLTPQLRRYVPIIITVEGIFYASEWGLLKLVLLDRFGFSPF